MNQGNTDMTAEMAPAEYPLLYVTIDDIRVNCMHGYADEMETAYLRDTITPIGTSRRVNIELDKYGQTIEEISYEVRSVEGGRLIENAVLEDTSDGTDTVYASFVVKDLIEQEKEYTLSFIVTLGSGEKVFYYTRLLEQEDYYVSEKLKFVQEFQQTTFDPELAATTLVTYLEPNAEGNNTTYQRVTIHSSLDQVTWGDLNPTQVGETQILIKEMMQETACLQTNFFVTTGKGKSQKLYQVTEYYRIRYGTERIYLLDYEREMNQVFDESAEVYGEQTVMLGITDPEKIQLTECDGGGIFAFVVGNRLFSYSEADGELALLFSFEEQVEADRIDLRETLDAHKIKILNVEESGSVQFAVYGYMNRGRHEGEVGIQINEYHSTENTIEEQVFIKYTKSPEMLIANLSQLLYADRNEKLYLYLEENVYCVNLETHSTSVVAANLKEGNYYASESNQMFVWLDGGDDEGADSMNVLNLSSGVKSVVDASAGEFIKPLGFIGNDLIYGLIRKSDVRTDRYGQIIWPMYRLIIRDDSGNTLKEYGEDGYFVIGVEVGETQILLSRIQWDAESESYVEAAGDQILSSEAVVSGRNTVISVVTEQYETIAEISLKSSLDKSDIKILTPKEVLFEGANEAILPADEEKDAQFFVYDMHGLQLVTSNPSRAVQLASDEAGVVMNDYGEYIWYRGNLASRNQIMKIEADSATDTKSALAVCLDTILRFEDVTRSSQYMLTRGESATQILEECIEDIQVLDLTGCTLDQVLFYLNQDIPILMVSGEGNAVMLTGFNDTEVVILDPNAGTLAKQKKTAVTETYVDAGYGFITYIRIAD